VAGSDGDGEWAVHLGSGGTDHKYHREASRAAPTVTSRANRWVLRRDRGQGISDRSGGTPDRELDQPAPPVTAGLHGPRMSWVQVTAGRTRPHDYTQPRDLDMPSHTVAFGHADMRWQGEDGESVRISVSEAGVLQTFPPGYPWQGGRTRQYQQAGNAFPPLAAAHVLAAAAGLPAPPAPPRGHPPAPAGPVTVRTSFGQPADDGRTGRHLIDAAARPAHTVTGKTGSWQVHRGRPAAGQ